MIEHGPTLVLTLVLLPRATSAVSLGLTRTRVLAFRDRTDRGAASSSRVFDVALKLPEALRKAAGAGLPDGLRTLGWERNEQCAPHFTTAEGCSRPGAQGKAPAARGQSHRLHERKHARRSRPRPRTPTCTCAQPMTPCVAAWLRALWTSI